MAKKKEVLQVGTLVFLPKRSICYSAIYIAVDFAEEELKPQYKHLARTRAVCHRIDLETGLPMICPDSRCQGKAICCAITRCGDWVENVEPLDEETIRVFSTEKPFVLDRKFAEQCLKFAKPKAKQKPKDPAEFAKFIESLLEK